MVLAIDGLDRSVMRSFMTGISLGQPTVPAIPELGVNTESRLTPWNACTVEAQARSIWRSCRSPASMSSVRPSSKWKLTRPDRRHLGRLAVHEPEAGIVAGPADAVAGPELHLLPPVDLDAARPGRDPARLPRDCPAVLAREPHRPGGVINACDPQLVALLNAEALVGPVEGHDIASHVVPGERLLGIGIAPRREPFRRQGRALTMRISPH